MSLKQFPGIFKVFYTPHGTHHTVHTTHTTRYTPHGTHHTVHNTRYTTHGTQHTVHTTRYTPHGTHHTVHTTRYTPHNTHHTVHTTRYIYTIFTEISRPFGNLRIFPDFFYDVLTLYYQFYENFYVCARSYKSNYIESLFTFGTYICTARRHQKYGSKPVVNKCFKESVFSGYSVFLQILVTWLPGYI